MQKFSRVLTVLGVAALFGAGGLGLGLAAGVRLGAFAGETFFERPEITQEEQRPFSFDDFPTELIPLDVIGVNIAEVVESVSDSVVSISLQASMGRLGQTTSGAGSGIIFAEDATRLFIATNNHVVEDASIIYVSLDDVEDVPAKKIGGNWSADLAVISVLREDLEGKPYVVAKFGDSDALRVGDEVIALGNPMGVGQTATRGIISAINRQISIDGRNLEVIQTDAAINPGNSGGALVNMSGEVIGINTAKAMDRTLSIEGMGYAIPSNGALEILQELLIEGTTPQPHLGVNIYVITEQHMRMYALPSLGLFVRAVVEGSAAHAAGVLPNDIIVGFDNEIIETFEDLRAAISATEVGQRVVLRLYRENALLNLDVIMGDSNA